MFGVLKPPCFRSRRSYEFHVHNGSYRFIRSYEIHGFFLAIPWFFLAIPVKPYFFQDPSKGINGSFNGLFGIASVRSDSSRRKRRSRISKRRWMETSMG